MVFLEIKSLVAQRNWITNLEENIGDRPLV